ncbi:MAG: hypothetical protein ACK559_34280, partial [bacterium]
MVRLKVLDQVGQDQRAARPVKEDHLLVHVAAAHEQLVELPGPGWRRAVAERVVHLQRHPVGRGPRLHLRGRPRGGPGEGGLPGRDVRVVNPV